MHLVLDGIIYSLQRQGGISVYFNELLIRVAQRGIAATLTLECPTVQTAVQAGKGSVRHLPIPARLLERFRDCRITAPAIFHSSYYRRPSMRTCPTVVTVHDFIYERFARGPRQLVHSIQKMASIKAAQAIICVSETTRADLLHFIGTRGGQTVHVIPNGVSDNYYPLQLPSSGTTYILYVGERRGYKNFSLVIEALEFLPDLRIICVGGGAFRKEETGKWPEGIDRRVNHAGFVSDAELNALYNGALCLVYPSSYEGFGIPVLEAMKAGCPVVCTDCMAVREIGEAALTIAEAAEPRAIAEAIEKLAVNAYRQTAIEMGIEIARRYSWQRTHDMTIDVYQSLGLGL